MTIIALRLVTGNRDLLFHLKPAPGYIQQMAFTDGRTTEVTADAVRMVEVLTDADLLVTHDGFNYDIPALARHLGLDFDHLAAKSVDVMLLARLVWPPVAKRDIDTSSPGATPDNAVTLTSLTGKIEWGDTIPHGGKKAGNTSIPRLNYPRQDPTGYLAAEARACLEVYRYLGRNHPDTTYARREERLHRLAAALRWRGVPVHAGNLEQFRQADVQQCDALREQLRAEGIEVKEDLTDDGKWTLSDIFAADLGRPLPTSGRNAAPSVSKKVLARYDHPMARAVAELHGSRGLPKSVAPLVTPAGRVHPLLDPSAQATGRWSVTEPGLTTYGKRSQRLLRDRAIFWAGEGMVMFAVDYNCIDVRALAALSHDPEMIARLQDGRDFHMEVADLVFGERTLPARSKAKPLSHAINYNASAETIATEANISVPAASTIQSALKQTFRVCETFKNDQIQAARAGQIITNGWGRTLRPTPGREHRQIPGLIGQAWSRDAVAEGLLRLADAGLDRYVHLHIHDEFVFIVPADRAEQIRDQVVEAMRFTRDGVPVLCHAGPFGITWRDAYRDEIGP